MSKIKGISAIALLFFAMTSIVLPDIASAGNLKCAITVPHAIKLLENTGQMESKYIVGIPGQIYLLLMRGK